MPKDYSELISEIHDNWDNDYIEDDVFNRYINFTFKMEFIESDDLLYEYNNKDYESHIKNIETGSNPDIDYYIESKTGEKITAINPPSITDGMKIYLKNRWEIYTDEQKSGTTTVLSTIPKNIILIIFIILFVVAFITGLIFAFIPIYLGGLLFILLWRRFLFHDLTWKKSMSFGLWSWLYFIL